MSLSKTEPSVCCVMLTANRPEMARQAVECFRRQKYSNARMAILNTGAGSDEGGRKIKSFHYPEGRGKTVGELRNVLPSAFVGEDNAPDILIHWDDDDYSHPNRIAEQVALLQSSGSDCVGYREMLFLDQRPMGPDGQLIPLSQARAWLYTNPNPSYALGTSLCYLRKAWESNPFDNTSQGEELAFMAASKVVGVSSFIGGYHEPDGLTPPRMVARIHSGNTSNAYDPAAMARAKEWKRVPAWDDYCRRIFA